MSDTIFSLANLAIHSLVAVYIVSRFTHGNSKCGQHLNHISVPANSLGQARMRENAEDVIIPNPGDGQRAPGNQLQEPANQLQGPANQLREPVNQPQQPANQRARRRVANLPRAPANLPQQPANLPHEPVNRLQEAVGPQGYQDIDDRRLQFSWKRRTNIRGRKEHLSVLI